MSRLSGLIYGELTKRIKELSTKEKLTKSEKEERERLIDERENRIRD